MTPIIRETTSTIAPIVDGQNLGIEPAVLVRENNWVDPAMVSPQVILIQGPGFIDTAMIAPMRI